MNEYPISPGYKFAGFLFAAAFFFGGFFLLYYAFHTPKRELMTLFLILGVLFMPLAAWVYRETIRLRVTVDGDMLVVQHAFSTRSITLSDVDGYRIGEKDAFFVVMKNGEKSLQLPKGVVRRKDLLAFIKEKYEDVDARERAAETEVLLEDSRYGGSREEREQNLKKAGMIGKIGVGVGFVLISWFFLYPQPYEVVMLLLFVAPPAAVYLTGSFKGLMRLYSKKSSPYPTLFVLMTFPILGAGLNALMRYDGKEVTVSRAFYQAVNTQDSVGVLLNKGKWGIPWYRVVRYSD